MPSFRAVEYYSHDTELVDSVGALVATEALNYAAELEAKAASIRVTAFASIDIIDRIVSVVNYAWPIGGADEIAVDWHASLGYYNKPTLKAWPRQPVPDWGALIPVMEALDAAGLVNANAWHNTDHADDYTREFTARIGDIELSIFARLPGDTSECRRVLKGFTDGYVSKPEPIYEFECSPGANPIEQQVPQPTGENHGKQQQTDIPL